MTRSTNGAPRLGRFFGAARKESIELYDEELEAAVRAEVGEEYDDYALITEYLAGDLSPADRERVEERLRTDPKFRALAEPLTMVWNLPKRLDRKEDLADRVEAEHGWQRLKKRIELEEQDIHTPTFDEKRAKSRRRHRFVFGTIATAITVWLASWLPRQLFPLPTMYVHTDAPVFQQRLVTLPDTTLVTLGPGSHLSYARSLSASDERTLNLDGEATFTIAAGHPPLVIDGAGVEVKTSEGRVSVHSFDGEPIAYVQVHEGSAEVRPHTVYASGQVLKVYAGEGVRVGPGLHIERLNVVRPQSVRIK